MGFKGWRMRMIFSSYQSGRSLTASSTFLAAEHLSHLDSSAAICSSSSTPIWPILNLVTRMPVMTASLCFALLRTLPHPQTFQPGPSRPGLFLEIAMQIIACAQPGYQPRPTTTSIYNDNMSSLPLHAIKGGGRAVGLTSPITL